MIAIRTLIIATLLLAISHMGYTQSRDSIDLESPYKFNLKHIIVPTSLIAVGSLSLYTGFAQRFDYGSRDLIKGRTKRTFDDYLQYSPIALMWAFDGLGIKSRHNFKLQTSIVVATYLTSTLLVYSTKRIIGRRRPDLSAYNSFPSGHTASAFAGVELLRLEFGQDYPWVGYLGYAIASTTAYMRIHNNRHWLTDTIAGAGVGILSARIGYWLAPKLNEWLWGGTSKSADGLHASLSPTVIDNSMGLGVSISF